MARSGDRPTRRPGSGSGSASRPTLEPTKPLSGVTALLQVLILLGIPIGLLLFAKVILKTFFPGLGY